MTTSTLVKQLKKENQDYEMYPSTPEMLRTIYDHMKSNYRMTSVLEIGCGTCNFIKYYKEYFGEEHKFQFFGMEKSKILIDALDKDVVLLGTDFNESTLIDKDVSVIFSNPPYSEYEEWMKRIIFEGNCEDVYLIVPQRWKDNKEIQDVIKKVRGEATVLGSFDFLDAERKARAKVDVVHIDKKYTDKDVAFDQWFDETFKLEKASANQESKKERVKKELVTGKNKVETLVNSYEHEQKILFDHFQAISGLDLDILESIGVSKDNVKSSLKQRISGLKNLYWEIVFDNLDEITSRLTWESRSNMLKKFTQIKHVDFTASNIYALIVYVCKNANRYYDEQLIDLFKKLSAKENVQPYKSNQATFEYDRWRFNSGDERAQKYTLDYRIISTYFNWTCNYSFDNKISARNVEASIGDICTIANNLGFKVGEKQYAESFGQKAYVYGTDGKVLFEYKIYKNRNAHFKFRKELIKAINVEASRLLGWIRSKADIKAEFQGELAKGAEQYFKQNNVIQLNKVLMLSAA